MKGVDHDRDLRHTAGQHSVMVRQRIVGVDYIHLSVLEEVHEATQRPDAESLPFFERTYLRVGLLENLRERAATAQARHTDLMAARLKSKRQVCSHSLRSANGQAIYQFDNAHFGELQQYAKQQETL
jgi:hypothetical protein